MSAVQPSTHPFTCNTCQVAFRSSELQRTHMQSDWHRYNLKRRVASLPPLSSEIFAEKVLANKASAAATAARASFEKSCADCQKTYYSENAYQNHLASQKHKANAMRRQKPAIIGDDETASVMSSTFSLGEPIDRPPNALVDGEAEAEFSQVVDRIKDASLEDHEPVSRRPSRPHHSAMEDRPEHPLSPAATRTPSSEASTATAIKTAEPLLTCLFCNFLSPSLELNLMHMSKQHGMFIPEREYLVDLEGLIKYLHDKIHEGHQCLYCGKYARSAFGAQTHMRDAGHCMIAFSTEEEQLEIGDFYDFRSTYSDDETESTDTEAGPGTGGVKLGARRAEQIAVEGADADGDKIMDDADDAGWETDSTLSSVPTDEITSVPIDDRSHMYARLGRHRHHSHSDPRPHRAADGWHSHAHATPHAVYHDDFELHLPSGRTAGHRSMARYFRQNLRNYPSAEESAEMRAIAEASLAEAEDSEEEQGGARGRQGRQDGRGRQLVSRANGGLGMVGVAEAKKREVRAVEKRERRREQRMQARYQWGNEKRANFQKHYRDPLLQ